MAQNWDTTNYALLTGFQWKSEQTLIFVWLELDWPTEIYLMNVHNSNNNKKRRDSRACTHTHSQQQQRIYKRECLVPPSSYVHILNLLIPLLLCVCTTFSLLYTASQNETFSFKHINSFPNTSIFSILINEDEEKLKKKEKNIRREKMADVEHTNGKVSVDDETVAHPSACI